MTCTHVWCLYDMMGIYISTHPYTKYAYKHARVNSKWSTQNHDTNNINISKAATASAAIESIVYLRTWSLAVAAVFFYQFSHFKKYTPLSLFPSSVVGSEKYNEKCVQIPIVYLYEISNCHWLDMYVIFNERLFRHWWKKWHKNDAEERSFNLAIFNFRQLPEVFEKSVEWERKKHTHVQIKWLTLAYAFSNETKWTIETNERMIERKNR